MRHEWNGKLQRKIVKKRCESRFPIQVMSIRPLWQLLPGSGVSLEQNC
jgi:hypothetical protein